MHEALKKPIQILFPATCVVCRKDIKQDFLCRFCLVDIKTSPTPLNSPLPFLDSLETSFEFEDTVREVLHAFKYKGKDYLSSLLTELWSARLDFNPDQIDLLVPVPMSFWKEIRRGYNQSALLASGLGKKWGKEVRKRCLRRRWFSPSQTRLSRENRIGNAARSFELNCQSSELKSQRILLVDDVCTTGATLAACASLLKNAGAAWVGGVAFSQEML